MVGRLLGASASPKVFDCGAGVTEFRHCLPREWMNVVSLAGPLAEIEFGTLGSHLNLPQPADIAAWVEHQIKTNFSEMSPSDARDLRDTPAASVREAVKAAEVFLENHRDEIVGLARSLFGNPRNREADAADEARWAARKEKAVAAVRARWSGGKPEKFDEVLEAEARRVLPTVADADAAVAAVMASFDRQVEELAFRIS